MLFVLLPGEANGADQLNSTHAVLSSTTDVCGAIRRVSLSEFVREEFVHQVSIDEVPVKLMKELATLLAKLPAVDRFI